MDRLVAEGTDARRRSFRRRVGPWRSDPGTHPRRRPGSGVTACGVRRASGPLGRDGRHGDRCGCRAARPDRAGGGPVGRHGTPTRRPSSTPASNCSVSGAADASCSRNATAASCGATAPTSCAAGSACSPPPTATCWPAPSRTPSGHGRTGAYVAAVHRINDAAEALERNPNESLLLQALLWSLPAASLSRLRRRLPRVLRRSMGQVLRARRGRPSR